MQNSCPELEGNSPKLKRNPQKKEDILNKNFKAHENAQECDIK